MFQLSRARRNTEAGLGTVFARTDLNGRDLFVLELTSSWSLLPCSILIALWDLLPSVDLVIDGDGIVRDWPREMTPRVTKKITMIIAIIASICKATEAGLVAELTML